MKLFFTVFALAAVASLVLATVVAAGIGKLGFPLPTNDRRLGSIDGLRGYLALSVLLHHFFIWVQITRLGSSWGPPSVNFINQLGTGSVGLFFMTTGLVFYPRVLTGFKSTSWATVFITRLFRIIPLVALSVAVVTVIIFARTHATPHVSDILGLMKWTSSFAEVPLLGYAESSRVNAGVLWSLWYEWLFYIFILPGSAGVMDLLRSRSLPTWFMPAALLLLGVLAKSYESHFNRPISVLAYAPLFAAGMIGFELRSRPTVCTLLSKPWIAISATGALIFAMVTTSSPFGVSLPLFGFFFTCVACGNDFGGLLRQRGALVLGECSFGIYLLHGVVLNVLFIDFSGRHQQLTLIAIPLLLPMAVVIVVMVTPAIYMLIERPAIGSGKLLSRWFAGRRAKLGRREWEVAP